LGSETGSLETPSSRRESTANLTTMSNTVGYIASVQLLIRRLA
jgi:hypothetical protein